MGWDMSRLTQGEARTTRCTKDGGALPWYLFWFGASLHQLMVMSHVMSFARTKCLCQTTKIVLGQAIVDPTAKKADGAPTNTTDVPLMHVKIHQTL